MATVYANGRQALVGDPVVGRTYNVRGVIVGYITAIDNSPTANCVVNFGGFGKLNEDLTQTNYLYHAADAYVAIGRPNGLSDDNALPQASNE